MNIFLIHWSQRKPQTKSSLGDKTQKNTGIFLRPKKIRDRSLDPKKYRACKFSTQKNTSDPPVMYTSSTSLGFSRLLQDINNPLKPGFYTVKRKVATHSEKCLLNTRFGYNFLTCNKTLCSKLNTWPVRRKTNGIDFLAKFCWPR